MERCTIMRFFLLVAFICFRTAISELGPEFDQPSEKPHSRRLLQTTTLEAPIGCDVEFDPTFTASLFPKNFTFGFATSAFQVEGAIFEDGRTPSIWDVYEETPGNILDGSNGSIACDSYHKYLEDVEYLRSLGVATYRFSLSWSRIFPLITGEVNTLGVNYYNNLIDALVVAGIQPMVTLYHWDLPVYFEDTIGGWLNSSIVDYFVEYADFCFETFGDRVKTWLTINEPQTSAVQGYSVGSMPPKRCTDRTLCPSGGNSSTEAYIAGHNALLAHAAAVARYRSKYQAIQGGKIGISLDSQFAFPLTNTTADIDSTERFMEFAYAWFADPIVNGDYPVLMRDILQDRLPTFTEEEKVSLKGSADFLGINLYTGLYTANSSGPAPGTGYPWTDSLTQLRDTNLNGTLLGQATSLIWLRVVPLAMYSLSMWVSNRYPDTPLLLTENGVSDLGNATASVAKCDIGRITYHQEYLAELLRAMNDGANIQGYSAWSLLDNFEGSSGYSQRFGTIYVDFDDDSRPRSPKMSALWWQFFLTSSP